MYIEDNELMRENQILYDITISESDVDLIERYIEGKEVKCIKSLLWDILEQIR